MQDRPTHILVECPELIVSASLGVIECLKPIERKGLCSVRFMRTLSIKSKDIVWADILVVVRGCEPLTAAIVDAAQKAGRLIIYYLDDDLLHIPSESLAYEYYKDPIIVDSMLKIMAKSDILWGANPNIKDKYLSLTRGKWIQNRVPKAIKRSVTELFDDVPINVLYAGSTDHQIIVRELLSPAIRRLCHKYGDKISFAFIGVDPGLNTLQNVSYYPFIKPYEAYEKFVCEGNYSIGLAPVREESFYGCKYYNKYLEYSAIGAAGIYTNAEPYTQVVENGVNGLLCENTIDGWYKAIELFLKNRDLLKTCAINATKDLKEHFNEVTVTTELMRQCPELYEYYAPKIVANSIHLNNSFWVFYLERAKLLWRQQGIFSIPGIVWRAGKVLVKVVINRIIYIAQKIF